MNLNRKKPTLQSLSPVQRNDSRFAGKVKLKLIMQKTSTQQLIGYLNFADEKLLTDVRNDGFPVALRPYKTGIGVSAI
jgi:hypothetical protein